MKAMIGRMHPSMGKPCMQVEAEKPMDSKMSAFLIFYECEIQNITLNVCLFWRFGLFNEVVDSRQAILPRGASSQYSSSVTPHISQWELEYQRMEEELRRMTIELPRTRQESGADKGYLVAYNAQMQAVVSVRNNIIKHLNRIYLYIS
jgi:hypothetical protein